jgi:hypothetical protein
MPLLHWVLQQESFEVQAWPSLTQAIALHVPPEQLRLQQSVDSLQVEPVARQLEAPQMLPVQLPPQQSPLALQAEPAPAHVDALQTLLVHEPEQQSLAMLQASPSPEQARLPLMSVEPLPLSRWQAVKVAARPTIPTIVDKRAIEASSAEGRTAAEAEQKDRDL